LKPIIEHEWLKRTSDATRIQRDIIKPRVDLYGSAPAEGLALGIECAFRENARKVYCAAVLIRYPGFTEIERSLAEEDTPFPYVAELSSFREGKVICKALETIQTKPDFIMIHGEGINAPSGIGVATHIGVLFDIPTIGCSRRLRFGVRPRVGKVRGAMTKMAIEGRDVAMVVRSKSDTKPIFISPGYKIGLDDSVRLVMSMIRGFRTPEPIRVPHLLVMRMKNEAEKIDPSPTPRRRTVAPRPPDPDDDE